jgi:3-oxocholest-4-en-26-oyl-CoA dehydrogenase beta subunit
VDFTFTEEQETIAKVARQLFEHRAIPEHLTELEAGDLRYDAALWRELATADLLGIALPENVGGSGHGFLELALLLAEVGWSVAPVPVYATLLLGADTIARHGDEGQRQRYLRDVVTGGRLLTAGLAEPGRSDATVPATTARRDGDGWRIDGGKELVPAAQIADTILVPAVDDEGVGIFIVDLKADGVEVRPAATTNGEPHADVFLDGAVVSGQDRLNGYGAEMIESLHARALVGLCAIQLGVTERALRIAAAYTTERAVRQAHRKLPGRAAADGGCVHRRRSDSLDHVAGRLAARGRQASLAGSPYREVLGGREGRRNRATSTRGHRHRHHVSPVPLLPMGQTPRADAGFGVRTVDSAGRSVLTKETNDERELSDVAHDDVGLAGHQRRR